MSNNIRDAFDSIRADEELKESTMQYLSLQRAENRQSPRSPLFRKLAAAACALLLVMAGYGGYSWVQTPVSYVSIDVNPSIELALNRLDQVLSVTAFNEEGAKIIRGLPLKGKKYTDAISLLMESSAMERYLTEEGELVFTVAAGSRDDAIQAGIDACHSHEGHTCENISADLSLVSAAHENGLSLGKYYAYLQLSAYDDTYTLDDCREMDISETHRCIHAHGQDEGSGSEDEGEDAEYEQYEEDKGNAEYVEPEETAPTEEDSGDQETDNWEGTCHHGGHGHH